jgi:CRP-like cAMP-binding protein
MKNELIEYMSQFTELSEEEAQLMIESYPLRTYKKGSVLLKEGQVSKDAFLVLKGCVRKYCLIDGEEKTTAFFMEGEVAIDFESAANHKPSKHYLECVEDSRIAVINSEKEEAYYKRFPRFEELSRAEAEKMMGSSQEALSSFITSSPEQRYLDLLQNRPKLLQRVPQHQIASYIGVTPESLSRIRKRIAKNLH